MVAGLTVGQGQVRGGGGRDARCHRRVRGTRREALAAWSHRRERLRCGGRRVQDAQGAGSGRRGAAGGNRPGDHGRGQRASRDRARLCCGSPSSPRPRQQRATPMRCPMPAWLRCSRRRLLAAPPTTCGSTSRRWPIPRSGQALGRSASRNALSRKWRRCSRALIAPRERGKEKGDTTRRAATAVTRAVVVSSPLSPVYAAVRMRGPSSVIATVCSKCADRLPSAVTTVHRSDSVRVAARRD